MKKGYCQNIEKLTKDNDCFRKVVYTAENMQLVLMSLKPGEDIKSEVHDENDQFFRFDSGEGKVVINGNEYDVEDGFAVVVPKGSEHNVINTGDRDLKFYTIYSPAHHKDQIVRDTKEEAMAREEDFDGETTE